MHEFGQLAGKRVGVSEYTMTAAVWVRGIMLDDYGVHWRDIRWVSKMDKRFPPPTSVDLESSPDNLEDLLAAGSIDALLMPRPQDLRLPSNQRRFRPLLDNVQAVERDYYERTGIFPIMHTVVVHRDALANWLARRLRRFSNSTRQEKSVRSSANWARAFCPGQTSNGTRR